MIPNPIFLHTAIISVNIEYRFGGTPNHEYDTFSVKLCFYDYTIKIAGKMLSKLPFELLVQHLINGKLLIEV